MTATPTISAGQIAPVTTLTNSSINTFMECPRKYDLTYRQGLRPEREADYFRIGGAYHLAQEVYAQTGAADKAVLAIYKNYENPPEHVAEDEALLDKWYYEATTCVCLFRGWLWWYGEGGGFEVIEAEQVFSVAIRSPETGAPTPRFRREGKIDKIVRLPDERVAVLEHKTSSEDITPGSDYWWRLKIDSQPSGYFVAARDRRITIHTVLYDVSRKPTIRPEQVPLRDELGYKIVIDADGKRIRNMSGKKMDDGQYKWRESGDAEKGFVLQTRKMELGEWEAKLMADIHARPEWYYQRGEIVRLDNDLRDYEIDLWNQQKQIAAAEAYGRFYRNTRACSGFNRRCPMFDLCTGRAAVGADGVPEGFRRATNPHEELEA